MDSYWPSSPDRSFSYTESLNNRTQPLARAPAVARAVGATPQAVEAASAPSLLTQQVLSWLPEDTETVIAANGPFVMHLKKQNSESTVNSEESAREIEETFKSLPLNLLGFESGILEKHFQSREISLALEGSRDFRAPSGLGEALFQGAEIVVFEDDISEDVSSFQSETREKSFGSELIEGFQVVLFQEKREQDIWTTFVAFPKSNIAVVATDRDYLREVLARVKGKLGQRALPTNLPEWNHVPGQAAFWALRHFSRQGAGEDPTSPFAARSAGSLSDPKAVGLTFYLDPAKSPVATVTYLSDGRNILENVNKNLFPIEHELGSKELHIQYRIVGPGAVRGTYDLTQIESRQVFLFVLMGLLGHAIFI